jgi:hypothetical protein
VWLWGTAAAKDGAIATGGFALIRLKPCAGYSPIHGLRFAVRWSLAVGFLGDWPWRVGVDDHEMTALSGKMAGHYCKHFPG